MQGRRTGVSWATVEYVPGRTRFKVEQYGPRRLWDETAAAWEWWLTQERPDRDRFGLTVDRDGQRVWLDEPDRLVPAPTAVSRRTRLPRTHP